MTSTGIRSTRDSLALDVLQFLMFLGTLSNRLGFVDVIPPLSILFPLCRCCSHLSCRCYSFRCYFPLQFDLCHKSLSSDLLFIKCQSCSTTFQRESLHCFSYNLSLFGKEFDRQFEVKMTNNQIPESMDAVVVHGKGKNKVLGFVHI